VLVALHSSDLELSKVHLCGPQVSQLHLARAAKPGHTNGMYVSAFSKLAQRSASLKLRGCWPEVGASSTTVSSNGAWRAMAASHSSRIRAGCASDT
jgi:hypothetical protein